MAARRLVIKGWLGEEASPRRRTTATGPFRPSNLLAWVVIALVVAGLPSRATAASSFAFSERVTYNAPNSAGIGLHRATTLADLDGDGKKDVVSSYTTALRAYIISGTSETNSFGIGIPVSAQHDTPAPPAFRWLVPGDFNEDGFEDVASGTGAYLSTGGGGFTVAEPFDPGAGGFDLDTADVNGDGHLDLLIVAGDRRPGVDVADTFRIRLGVGNGTFGPAHDYVVPRRSPFPNGEGQPGVLAPTDLDGDGDQDLLVTDAGLGVHLYVNAGGGEFGAPTTLPVSGANRVAVSDLDNDGSVDLVIGTSGATIVTVRGHGDGTFDPPSPIVAGFGGPFGLGDFDQDGNLDLAISGGAPSAWRLHVAAGLGDGTFNTPDPVGGAYPDSASELIIADLNRDSRPDVTVHNGDFSLPANTLLNMTPAADVEPPTVSAAVSPAANVAGWHRSVVTVSFTCVDGGSGVASCPAPVVVSGEGAGQVVSGTATDNASNSATATASVSLDRTAPSLVLDSPADGSSVPVAGYVAPSCSASDEVSGLDGVCQVIVSAPVMVVGGLRYTATASTRDAAGNEATLSRTYTVVTDAAAPEIAAQPDRGPNAYGWYSGSVTYSFTCTDESPIASCPSPVTITTQGANQSFEVTATDVYGNVGALTVAGINIDTTDPSVVFSGNQGTYTPDQPLSITCTPSDGLSGIDVATCPGLSGGAAQLAVGTNVLTAMARDRAGNEVTVLATVTLVVTVGSLGNLIDSYISNAGVANSLKAKVAAGNLAAFINEVEAKCCAPSPGKSLTRIQADTLIRLATAL